MSTNSEPKPPTGAEITATPPPIIAQLAPTAPLSADDLIVLNEEIAALAKAGMPLDQGLYALSRDMGRGRLRDVTARLASDLRSGCTLPEALERQGTRVPPYYAALLAAGVRSGKLGDVLGTLTLHARTLADFRATVLGAFLYPTIVAFIGTVALLVSSVVVLPMYKNLFLEFKMKLPLVTEFLFFVGEYIPMVIGVLIAIPLLVLLLQTFWFSRTLAGRLRWARFVYAIPLFGTVVRAARLSAFAQLLGILVDQKIPLPEALALAAETSSDPLLQEGSKRIEEDLRQGTPFGVALKQQRLVPALFVWLIAFGERQGTLGESLRQLAQMYRRQAEARTSLLRTILPPLLIVLVAGTLGLLFVCGLLMPMFELLDGLSGGGKK